MGQLRMSSLAAASLIVLAGCGATTHSAGPGSPAAEATTTSTTAPSTSTTSTSTTSSSTTSTSTSSSTTTSTVPPLHDPGLAATNAAFEHLAAQNPAVSMTVVHGGTPVLQRSSGHTVDGSATTTDSPMVVASLSKLLTATAVARLSQVGLIDIAAPVPWSEIGVSVDPAWHDVTVRELLDHTSGMPVVRGSWFEHGGTCADILPWLVAAPPQPHRGRWTYSNGNYCALGLLVEAVSGRPLDVAVDGLALAPAGAGGAHLTTDGLHATDVPYALGVERLARLGGAGGFVVSTDDLAAMLAHVSADDRVTLTWPAVMTDQYGWGHTGTVDGAKACAWVLDGGRTVVVTTVAGSRPSTGGGVCDLVVPALATDLGAPAGEPERSPA